MHFEAFGEIIEIDIKKQGASTYAFIQYSDISSVVKAMRKLDGENLGASSNRIKLGFGKSMPTNCIWIHSTVEISEKSILKQSARFGQVLNVAIDRSRSTCLVTFNAIEFAQNMLTELKGRNSSSTRRLQVDFASRECQNSFLTKLDTTNSNANSGGVVSVGGGTSSSIHSRLGSSTSNSNFVNSNTLLSTGLKDDCKTPSDRLSSRLGSVTSSPRDSSSATNLPPLPQWSSSNSRDKFDNALNPTAQPASSAAANYRLSRLSSTINSTSQVNNSSASGHSKSYPPDAEEYGDSMDTDFYECHNSSSHHRRLSEYREDKLRGHSPPHRSLDCDNNNSKVLPNDRHLDDKTLLYKLAEYGSSSKER